MESLRQTGKRRLPMQTDSQHECETEIIHRLNIPRPPCQAWWGADLPTFSPARTLSRGREDLVPWAWCSPASESLHYLLLGSPRPQRQGSGLPPREGSPGHRSRHYPPSFPPSLLRPPSLPPSHAAARGALPRTTCSGPNPGISERKKKKRKKKRKN